MRQDVPLPGIVEKTEPDQTSQQKFISTQVTNHLANERTFLAWIRTGLATVTLGFVIAKFGLFLREFGLHTNTTTTVASSPQFSSFFGIALTILGLAAIVFALISFLRIRRDIDKNQFHPPASFAVFFTILACFIGLLLMVYLFLTA